MRSALCLAALAAMLALASAGPGNNVPGCHSTDTIQRYKIKGASFVDIVKRNFVDMAYIQARKRGRDVAAAMPAQAGCTYIGHTPVRACYNSIVAINGQQMVGQYGFVFLANFKCATGKVAVKCRARLDTNRTNRPLAVPGRPGVPSFWAPPVVICL